MFHLQDTPIQIEDDDETECDVINPEAENFEIDDQLIRVKML